MDAGEVARRAEEEGLRLVRFLWCGNDGTVRAKASSLRGLEDRIRTGIGLTVAALLGSTANAVLREAKVPVTLVK